MHPDSLKIADDVDRDIAKDINKNSYQRPLAWDPVENYQHLAQEIAFPNPCSYNWIGSVGRAFSPRNIISPLTQLFQWAKDVLSAESWSESASLLVSSIKTQT